MPPERSLHSEAGARYPSVLPMPVPRLREQHVRHPAARARCEHAAGLARVETLPLASLGAVAGQRLEPRLDVVLSERDLCGLGPLGRFLPFGKLGEQPLLGPLGPGDVRREHLRPRPAHTHQRLQRAPCAFALGPVLGFAPREQRAGGLLQQGRNRIVVRRLGQAECVRQALGRRHDETSRMHEGIELEQVKAREVGIAEPRRHQRRVEHQQRSVGRGHDRLALAERAGDPGGVAQPGSGMAGVEGRERERGHLDPMQEAERKVNAATPETHLARLRRVARPRFAAFLFRTVLEPPLENG